MIKLRVEGIPEEVDEFVATLETSCEVLSKSAPYKNRGESRYIRVYVDVISCKKKDTVAEKLIREFILADSDDYCSSCVYCDEDEQRRLCDEDETQDCCMQRRNCGQTACIEGICKYFEKE